MKKGVSGSCGVILYSSTKPRKHDRATNDVKHLFFVLDYFVTFSVVRNCWIRNCDSIRRILWIELHQAANP